MAATTPFVRDDVRAFLDMLKAMNRPGLHEMPVAEARIASAKLTQMGDAAPHYVAVKRDLACPGPAGEIGLRLYDVRDDRGPGPVLVFFHGGGFTIGSIASYDSLCSAIAVGLDMPVVSVEYRLAPEHPFPAAPDDCEAAARWVAANGDAFGREITGLVLMGDSAGGNLAIVTSQALAREAAAVPVLLQVPLYPVAGSVADTASFGQFSEGYLLTQDTMAWFDRGYAPDTKDVRNRPLLADDHTATPPTIVVTAGLDPLRDSGRQYAAHLIGAGVDTVYLERSGTIHGFMNLRRAIPSGADDLDQTLAAVRTMLGRPMPGRQMPENAA